MQLIPTMQQMQYIDVDSERVPCSLLCKLVDRTYRLTFAYNEHGGFFTLDLEIANSTGNIPLAYGEVLRLDKPCFEAFNDERYPLPILVPMCVTGDDIQAITYDNFGNKIKLYLVERPGGEP